MIQKIKKMILAGAFVLAASVPALVVAPSAFAANAIQEGLCSGATTASESGSGLASGSGGCQANGTNTTQQIGDIARLIINILSIIVGVVAVIMIIVGGFKYITSGGDSGKVGSAKNTIIYAIIGLILVALAQIIVNVVLSQASNIT
jgi:hypothetical protein